LPRRYVIEYIGFAATRVEPIEEHAWQKCRRR
jgi:hypothetical protein